MDVPERWRFNGYLGNRCLHAAFQVFFRFFAGSFATIKQIEEQRFVRYINHVDIVNVDSLYNTAASSGALEAQAYVCAEESTICYIDVFTPPDISLPTTKPPWPCNTVLFFTITFWQGSPRLRPSSSLPDLIQMASSPASKILLIINAFLQDSKSKASPF